MTLTKTDRERVTCAVGRPPRAALGLGPRPPSGGEGPQQNPRRRTASRNTLCCLARGCGRLAGRASTSDVIIINTTLGNGYLGSRIDEERSKMRYLV